MAGNRAFSSRIRRVLRAASVRWECIRRSKYYRADWEEFCSRFENCFAIRKVTQVERRTWMLDLEPRLAQRQRDKRYYESQVWPYLFAFSVKWGLLIRLLPSTPLTQQIGRTTN